MESQAVEPITFTWAAWARRERARWMGLFAAAVLLGAVLVILIPFEVFLMRLTGGVFMIILAAAVLFASRRDRPVLTIEHEVIRYERRGQEIRSPWNNVRSIEDERDWLLRRRGPMLVLHMDATVDDGHGDLRTLAQVLNAPFGQGHTGSLADGTRIPLASFADRPFRGSGLEAELRRHIPDLVTDYLAKRPA